MPHTEAKSDIIPHDMAVVTITEILGERCCRPAYMVAKRRRCGPRERDRSRGQEYLVRGFFDGDDEEGEDSEDDADAVHHSNTFWVSVDVVLEIIGIADLKKSWSRATLRCLRTSLPPRGECRGKERWAARAGWLCQEGYTSAARGSVVGSAAT